MKKSTESLANFLGTAAAQYRSYVAQENQKLRNEQAAVNRNNLLTVAFQEYENICVFVSEVLEKNAATLGVLAPGYPEAVAVKDWYYVSTQGRIVFRIKVKCRASNTDSQRVLWSALQDAFDTSSYFRGLQRLFIGGLTADANDWYVASLAWVAWE